MKSYSNYLSLLLVFGVSACSFIQGNESNFAASGTMIVAQAIDRNFPQTESLVPLIGFSPEALISSPEYVQAEEGFAPSGSIIVSGTVPVTTREELGPVLSFVSTESEKSFNESGTIVMSGKRVLRHTEVLPEKELVPVLGFAPQPW